LNGDADHVIGEIFGSGELSGVVAQQWLERYRKGEAQALLELINCVLRCVGCQQEVTLDDIRDPENIPNRLADLHNAYQEVCASMRTTPHPR
jgi:cohesin complex subunit SA-1/2